MIANHQNGFLYSSFHTYSDQVAWRVNYPQQDALTECTQCEQQGNVQLLNYKTEAMVLGAEMSDLYKLAILRKLCNSKSLVWSIKSKTYRNLFTESVTYM